jgi:SAM-dependent methyltransferase
MKADNILANMPELEGRAGQYFIHRPLAAQPDYEEHYWNVIVDPDGNTRDRLSERDRFLANVSHEVQFLRGLTPGRMLDIGCGLGFLLSAMDNRWERHGVELSAFAARHAQNYGDIFVGDVFQARYPNEHFDVIVMHHVIEHIPDPVATIREVLRILKPGGHLVLGTPDFDSGCARLFGNNYRLLHDPTHVSLFSNDSMHRFLRDHGFTIDRVDYPYFETPYFTEDNLNRLFDRAHVSPPFYGNFMTFYCRKSAGAENLQRLRELTREVERLAPAVQQGAELLANLHDGGSLYVYADATARAIVADLSADRPVANVTLIENAADLESMTLAVLLLITSDADREEIRNIIQLARNRGIRTIALTGGMECDPRETADVDIRIRSNSRFALRTVQALLLSCLSEDVAKRGTGKQLSLQPESLGHVIRQFDAS